MLIANLIFRTSEPKNVSISEGLYIINVILLSATYINWILKKDRYMRAYIFIYLFVVLGNNLYGIFICLSRTHSRGYVTHLVSYKKAMKFRNVYPLNLDLEMHGQVKGRVKKVRLKKKLN